jgi:hypothetical protein
MMNVALRHRAAKVEVILSRHERVVVTNERLERGTVTQ